MSKRARICIANAHDRRRAAMQRCSVARMGRSGRGGKTHRGEHDNDLYRRHEPQSDRQPLEDAPYILHDTRQSDCRRLIDLLLQSSALQRDGGLCSNWSQLGSAPLFRLKEAFWPSRPFAAAVSCAPSNLLKAPLQYLFWTLIDVSRTRGFRRGPNECRAVTNLPRFVGRAETPSVSSRLKTC